MLKTIFSSDLQAQIMRVLIEVDEAATKNRTRIVQIIRIYTDQKQKNNP